MRTCAPMLWVILVYTAELSLGEGLRAELNARSHVPGPAEQAIAERQVRQAFQDDFAKARRDPVDREALGRKLLIEAQQPQNDSAVRFVLLRDARDIAADVGDIKTLTAAAALISESYQITRSGALLPALQAAAKAPLLTTAAVDLAEISLTTTEELMADNDFETASKLAGVAEQAARQAGDAVLAARVAERSAVIRSLKSGYQRAAPAIQKLKTDPSNPALNLIAGKFFCFDKGDWEHGLPYLARGSDSELKQLAILDLKSPGRAAEQAALGDRYWQAAGRATNAAKASLQLKARYWYGKALPSIEGLESARIKDRLNTDEVWKLHGMIKPDDSSVRPTAEGVETTGQGKILTSNELRVPVRIDATVKTESTNIRLFFGEKGVLIFNWELNPDELRFHAPGSGGITPVPGQGRVTPNAWVHITWIIEPTGATVLVNGQRRAVFHGNYAGLSGNAGIGGADAKVTIRQFDFSQTTAANQ